MKKVGLVFIVWMTGVSSLTYAAGDWRSYVQTQALSELTIELKQSFAAEVISPNQTQLASEINARVLSITTRPGSLINKDQVLASLDCQDFELQQQRILAQQKQANANLDLARLQVKRVRDLAKRELTSENQLDDAQNQVIQNQTTLEVLAVDLAIAKRQIERCQLRAPFEGVVVSQHLGVGQWVSTGTPIFTLLQTSNAEIETQVPLSWFDQNNQAWQAEFNSNGELFKQLVLLRQSAAIDARSRSIKLWFSAPKNLQIGRSGELTLTHPDLHIPANIIVKRDKQYGVYAVENDQLIFRPLPNAQEGRPFAVPKDWAPDLRLVTAGQNRLNLNKLD